MEESSLVLHKQRLNRADTDVNLILVKYKVAQMTDVERFLI